MHTHVCEVATTTLELIRKWPETIKLEHIELVGGLVPFVENPSVEVALKAMAWVGVDKVLAGNSELKVLEWTSRNASTARSWWGDVWERRNIQLDAVAAEPNRRICEHDFGAQADNVCGRIPVSTDVSYTAWDGNG